MLACLLSQLVPRAWAQSYQARPVRMVLGTSAGGGGDVIGRIIAQGLTQHWGQQVIIDNRPGAASNIAAEIVAKAAPDGYTLLEVSITHAVNASLYRRLPFSLMRDFAAVTQFASSPQVVVVHPSLSVKALAELVRLAQAKPAAMNYASAGSGTSTFLAAELFKGQAGIKLTHVPYRGGGAALAAALSGEAPVYFALVASSLPHIQAGRLRALAVTSAKRLPVMPEYPTVAESGYAGYECGNWYGALVPVGTPPATIAAIHGATIAVLKQPEVNRRLVDLGYIVVGDRPEEFAAFIRSEIGKLAKLVKDLNLTAE
jgi:tripartite-type tricarboxylate transporter receptor subunit TctC